MGRRRQRRENLSMSTPATESLERHAMKPRVFTIPPSVPFLPALIGALKDGRLSDDLFGADPLVFADMASGVAAADALDLPPALGGLERRFLLATLVHAWAKGLEPATGEP